MGTVFSTSAEFYKLDKKSFKDFLTTGFVMPLIVMAISMLVLCYFREELRVAYGFPYAFAWIIPLITFFTFCNEQLLAVSRNNNQPGVHLKSNIGKTIIELGLSFVLVVFFGWQWQGRIAGIIIAYFFIAGYSLYYFIKNDYLFGSFKISFLKPPFFGIING